MKWINFIFAIVLIFNTTLLFIFLKKSTEKNNFNREYSQVYLKNNKSTQLSEVEQQYYYLSEQVQALSGQLKNIETYLTNDENIQPNLIKVKKQETNLLELSETINQANEKGAIAVDNILIAGTLDQNGAITLRQTMAQMSADEHHKVLQKLIIAINNGNLVMQPGALL
ncbi:hypothetical protein [Aliikangiella sp. IMCC44359]|uniref:hypothetical protein n=1 Tax=Aliikangiella sp. IMCC44359 TaxID=3459125 RepID=UPI00403B13F5